MNEQGHVVLPVFGREDLLYIQQGFRDMIASCTQSLRAEVVRELLVSNYASPRVTGDGFSTLPYAETYHHPFTRWVRWRVHRVAYPYLKKLPAGVGELSILDGARVMQLLDRYKLEPVGVHPTGGAAWHRDYTPLAQWNDRVFGGWVNLNLDLTQWLRYVPGTAIPQPQCNRENWGFKKLPKPERDELKKRSLEVPIPPGHLLMFDETSVHDVYSLRKKQQPQLRLFTAFMRNTRHAVNERHPMAQSNLDVILRQSVPPLRAGKANPLYPALYNRFHTDRRDALLGNLTPAARRAGDLMNGKFPYVCPPLSSPGMTPFPPYPLRDVNVVQFQ